MIHYRFGGKNGKRFGLTESPGLLAIRTRSRKPVLGSASFRAALSAKASEVLSHFAPECEFPMAGVAVLRAAQGRGTAVRDEARKVLKTESDIRFAGRVLVDPKSKSPVLYTENLYVKFEDDCSAAAARKILRQLKFEIKEMPAYSRNAYFVALPEGSGFDEVFGAAEKLLENSVVEFCHPEMIRQVRERAAFPQQWHLAKTTISGAVIDQHASVTAAWPMADGTGVTIAVIDTGIDIDHEEFRSAGKLVAPFDATLRTNNPRPGPGENHGTACAGVACGDGSFGASGVAPKARLIPIRLRSGLGSMAEARAFEHAAVNGADVISCSWGPNDGDPSDPNDPVHQSVVALPDSTREAIEFATGSGRNGKGCVVLFAAGNGNESVDNDGYASFPKVVAVAACNDSGKRSFYSDFGNAVWCSFPSNDIVPARTTGIWTTDRSGPAGYNPGGSLFSGDTGGNYTNSFGGTSSAAPGAAGVAALILSRNPALRRDEVHDILKRCCDRIDTAGGAYDANGHSSLYGFGRLNAKRAVELAMPAAPTDVQIRTAARDVPVLDLKTSTLDLPVADNRALTALKVSVDIEHTFIGDLVVKVIPPAAAGAAPVLLHDRSGGGTQNLRKTYDAISTPGLAAYTGKNPLGTWTLEVADKDRRDEGTIKSFTLEFHF